MASSNLDYQPIDLEKFFFHDNFAGSSVAEDGANVFISVFKTDSILLRLVFIGSGFRSSSQIIFIQNKNLRTRRTGRLLKHE